jgi:hypothetical protein
MDHRQVSSSPTSLSVRMADMALGVTFSPEMPALPPTDVQSPSYNLSPLLPHFTLPEYPWGASSADDSDASSAFSHREFESNASLLFEAPPRPLIYVDNSTFDSRSRTRSDITVPTAASNNRLTAPPRSFSTQRPEPGFFWSGTVPSTPDTPSSYGLSTPSSHGPSSPYPSGVMTTLELPLHQQISSPANLLAEGNTAAIWPLEDGGPPGGESAGGPHFLSLSLRDLDLSTSHNHSSNEPSEFCASSQSRDLQMQDGAGLPTRPQASPAGVHAANLRRKKDVQFYCKYCSAGFTAKHNLRSTFFMLTMHRS